MALKGACMSKEDILSVKTMLEYSEESGVSPEFVRKADLV